MSKTLKEYIEGKRYRPRLEIEIFRHDVEICVAKAFAAVLLALAIGGAVYLMTNRYNETHYQELTAMAARYR